MKKHIALILYVTVLFAFIHCRAFSQNATVAVVGEVEKPLLLDAAYFKKMPRVTVRRIAHFDHKEHTYTGIPLSEIIRECGAIPNNELKGKSLSKYVLIKAGDGYQAVIALPEIDTAFTDKVIILADMADGKPLPPDVGPFQIIVPGDKRPARCVRQVISINILSAKLN
jgi:DMSO/TMAO reductase YedYZ molybdopterin-dependent catalytic subunit